ncbi:glycosyltransferase family A protein [Candidatus Pelagibacter sp.]|nr:glycosyltransferase family A protein [Candidatus Pelagibacter sp.]
MIKFSVVIPCYKINKLFFKTLSSVFKQTTKAYEIIIIFSNKISQNQNNLLLKKYKNLKIFLFNNGNASQNRNYGALKAKGSYLAFLDDDDLWNKDYLRYIEKSLKKNKSKLIITWLNKIKDNRVSKFKEMSQELKSEDLFNFNPGIIGSNIVIEKKIFKKIGGFDKKLTSSEDKDFLIRFLDKKLKFNILKKRLVYHRQKNQKQLSYDITGKQLFLKKYKYRMSKKNIYINERRIFLLKWKNLSYLLKIIYFFNFFYKLIIYKSGI